MQRMRSPAIDDNEYVPSSSCFHTRFKHSSIRCVLHVLTIAFAVLLNPAGTWAQTSSAAPKDSPSAKPASPQADIFGRDTPRGAVAGLVSAMAERDYNRAGRFFEDEADARQLSEELQSVLDAGASVDSYAALSNSAQGNIEDGLNPSVERVGTFSDQSKTPILLRRGKGPGGAEVWRVARETSGAARQLHEHRSRNSDNSAPQVAGASVTDWLTLLGIAALVFLGFQLVNAGILFVIGRTVKDREKSRLYRVTHAGTPPLSLLCATLVFEFWAGSLPVSFIARQILLRYVGVFAWVALAWFLTRVVDAAAGIVTSRMEGPERRQAVSVISLLRRGAKLLLLFVAVVAILDTFGVNVTTGVAALGVGGIALALGAQKTVENLVGSITLIADKPVQVGDFCKVGDVLGTVEDVGIRSTRIRTLERTIVTIPNGDFAARQIENFSRRDSFLCSLLIRLEHGIGSARLLEAVEMIEATLKSNERVIQPGARARIKDIAISSIDIEIFSYIRATDFDESLLIRQDLLLSLIATLERAEIAISYPTQTLQLRRNQSYSSELAKPSALPINE